MDSFEKNGLHFRVLDASKKTVAVRMISSHISFQKAVAKRSRGSFVLRIPKTVRHGWKFYTVTEIDDESDFKNYSYYTSTEDKRFKDGYRRELRTSYKSYIGFSETPIISVEFPKTIEKIGSRAFKECKELEKVDLSSTSLVEIGDWAFWGCDKLTKVELPDTVKVIGESAFSGCDKLEKVDLSSTKLVEIGETTFSACGSLTKVELPDTVKVIGKEAFSWCKKLQEIHIPTSLEKIGESAFRRCESLKEIKIPSNVVYIGWEAFKYIRKLKVTIYNSKDKVNSAYAFDEDAIIEYKDKGL